MNRSVWASWLLLFAIAAPPVAAVKPGGILVVLPIVGRTPGAYDTQWSTDVFVRNTYGGAAIDGRMTFYVSDGRVLEASFTLEPAQGATFRDVVKSTFGLDTASGQLHVASMGEFNIEARARIFNSGNPVGEFGQGVEGIGVQWLQTQARILGLDGREGNRVNVGVANPYAASVGVTMRIADKDNAELYREDLSLAAHQTLQINDIFARYSIPPQDDVMVEFWGVLPIYGYSSEVRNDTGDAVFVFGTGPNAP